ncbi:MAG: Gfo/Idh/MocA family oxidoreductase, partial [Acidimicrobiia bacterium]
ISLPNRDHAEWGIKAASNGKHVLIEKPIAVNRDQVMELRRAAQANGVAIQEASMMRFHPQTALLRDLVAGGAIGTPRWAQGSFSFTLRRQEDIRLEQPGGGSIWDLGSYPITLFQAVLQLAPFEVVGLMHSAETDVDMTFGAQIRYEGDVLGLFLTSMEAIPSWYVEFVGSTGRLRATYPWLSHIGVESTVEAVQINDAPPTGAFGDGVDNQSTRTFTFPDVNAYLDEVLAMESMILDKGDEVFPLEESATNIATITALVDSATSLTHVAVDD